MGVLRSYTLSHITTFRATNVSFAFPGLFFSNITLPAIEELHLTIYDDKNCIIPICFMILRSSLPCLLRMLYLDYCADMDNLSSLLKLTPLLTSLTVNFPPVDDIFALIFDGNTPPLAPPLDECKFLPFLWRQFRY